MPCVHRGHGDLRLDTTRLSSVRPPNPSVPQPKASHQTHEQGWEDFGCSDEAALACGGCVCRVCTGPEDKLRQACLVAFAVCQGQILTWHGRHGFRVRQSHRHRADAEPEMIEAVVFLRKMSCVLLTRVLVKWRWEQRLRPQLAGGISVVACQNWPNTPRQLDKGAVSPFVRSPSFSPHRRRIGIFRLPTRRKCAEACAHSHTCCSTSACMVSVLDAGDRISATEVHTLPTPRRRPRDTR